LASFPSKLLLFGEYGLMFDAMALSVPFPKFSGYLDLDTDDSHQKSSAEICKFFEHLQTGESYQKLHFTFDLESLENDLSKGLYFNSNIPQQYGVGSSGALVAALFSGYAAFSVPKDELSPELLKTDFSILESHFHGRSSGLDPLISFLKRPLLIDSKKTIQRVQFDLNQSGLSIALIDTKTTGATGPLVQHFIDRFNFPEFEMAFERQFISSNNGCIESLLISNTAEFFLFLEQLIVFQLQHFSRMIPGDFHSVISDALEEKVFIKLLG
jgi:mevalonate kinase